MNVEISVTNIYNSNAPIKSKVIEIILSIMVKRCVIFGLPTTVGAWLVVAAFGKRPARAGVG